MRIFIIRIFVFDTSIMKELVDKIKLQFSQGSMAIKLIMINVAVFIGLVLVSLVVKSFDENFNILVYVGVTSHWQGILTKPWTLLTHFFSHSLDGIGHLFWNMVVLYFSGSFFVTKLGSKKLLSVYLAGGFSGFLFFFLGYNLLPSFSLFSGSYLVGASAACLSVLVAIGVVYNEYPLKFTFLKNPIKLGYIVAGIVLFDLVRLQANIGVVNGNSGGWLAHLGGIVFGLFYGIRTMKGVNVLKPFERFLDRLFSFSFSSKITKPKMKVKKGGKVERKKDPKIKDYSGRENKGKMDAILEKVKKSGYDSLTEQEKELFFSKSNK